MPSKSMSPMPMQSKIGDASLKFGPDWLRALSSDSSTSAPTSPWSGGSGGGGGTPGLSNNSNSPSSGGGNGFGGSGHNHQGYHQHQSYNSGGGGGGYSRSYSSSSGIGTGSSPSSQSSTSANRYKPSEFRYTREEVLSLYDKNLAPPEFLPAFGTLFIEKMQPPLAFSQPSEEELRIWHIPQPESSRQANMGGPPMMGRGGGYSIRGRGSIIERGRGRGRGSYYGGRPPYDEEERVRPRAFERSLSAHERASWAERNGTVAGGQGTSPPEDGSVRGGGSWRNRERDSYGSKRVDEDDGWRKPRWRRDDDEEGSRRRLHKSWSEDGTHDNLPEWAKDSTDEREGGTFDSSGAFLEEEGYSAKTNAFEKRRREERERSSSESESHGSHNERGAVQKKTPDRNSMKPVIPPSLKEEADESAPDPGESEPSMNRTSRGSSKEPENKMGNSSSATDARTNNESSSRHKAEADNKRIPEHHTASNFNKARRPENEDPRSGKSHHGESHPGRKQLLDEDQYLDMTEEASSLVAKLIDEDVKEHRAQNSSIPMMLPIGMSHSSPNIPNHGTGAGPNAAMEIGLDRISPGVLQATPPPSIDSLETWFYRDPQGNVQGPFRSAEMHQWFDQGYFTGGLLLRRECDKIFITLYEMGKLYGRNPFDSYEPDSPPPPPIMEPQLSALEQDGNLQAQYQQKQQLLQQQKYLQSMNQNAMRNETDRWGNMGAQATPLVQQHGGGVIGQGTSEVPPHVQAQMILNLVKNAGANVDASSPNPIEHLQALFNRQAQLKGGEPQSKAEFVSSLSILQTQLTAQMEHQKAQPSVASNSDAMQSLIQQLTSMSTQQQIQSQMQKPTIPKTTEASGSGWGSAPGPQFTANQQMQGWGQQPPNPNVVWEYRDQMMKLQQQKVEEEMRRKKLEDDKERKRLIEEEERCREEQHKRQQELEEEKRKMIEEQLKEKYLLQKKQQEEIMKQQAAELAAARRREEEKRLELEEEKRKALMLQEELMRKKQEEMMRQHQEMERQRIAEMQRQQYEQQKLEQQRLQEQHRLQEQQRLLEQQQMREEDERRRQQEHEELQRREREQREEQHRREREEQQRREREEQQRREQQNKFSWNSPPSGNSSLPIVQTRTLLEIQQEEAVKQQEEIVRQQVLKKKQLQQQQEQQRLQQQNSSFKWAQATQAQKVQTKSFTEIQAEEAAKLAQQQERDRENRAIIQQHSHQQQMWSSSLTWANRASLNAPNTSKTNGGAWGDSAPASSTTKSASNKSQFPTVQQTQAKRPTNAKESEDMMKLFQEHNMKQPTRNQQTSQSEMPEDEFTRWCFTTVKNISNPGMDIPIFINFLKEVESPYEVNDYIVSYLGDGRDAREFGKEFLERRSRWRNANKGNKDCGGLEDNLCLPASAVNPVNSEFQEVKVKGKKGKKGKMQKVDSRILGFTTNAGNKRDYGGDSTD